MSSAELSTGKGGVKSRIGSVRWFMGRGLF